MATKYRLEVASPATATGSAKTWLFAPETENVLAIECELKKEHHRISVLTARIHDPKGEILSAIPDPAFEDVPVRLYMSKPGDANDVSYLVFDGIATEYTEDFPGPETLQIVAHDKSIDMRRNARARTFRGLTSVQIAKQIAAEYGFELDTDIPGTLTIVNRDFDHGAMAISDWEHMGRALAGDGLEVHVDPKTNKITVRQKASRQYATVFRRGDDLIHRFSVRIAHVRGPGKGGDRQTPALSPEGTVRAATGNAASATNKQGAVERTHRVPIGVIPSSNTGAHSEAGGSPWTNQITRMAQRKDTAQLVTQPLPDITLRDTVKVEGFGAKKDGVWNIVSIRQVPTGDSAKATTITLQRAPSEGATKQSSVVRSEATP